MKKERWGLLKGLPGIPPRTKARESTDGSVTFTHKGYSLRFNKHALRAMPDWFVKLKDCKEKD